MLDGLDPSSALAGGAFAAALIALVDAHGPRRRAGVALAGLALAVALIASSGWAPVGLARASLLVAAASTSSWLRSRRPVRLTAEQHRLHRLAFAEMSPAECQRLLVAGTWKDASGGERLMRAGKAPNRVLLLVQGMAELRHHDEVRGAVAPGRMLGEVGWVTGQPTETDVFSTEAVRYVEWSRAELETLFSRRPELRPLFHVAVARGVASKMSLL